MLARLNEKITENDDILDQDRLLCKTRKHYEETISDLKRKLASMEASATKDSLLKENLRTENDRLESENQRLTETVEKFQNYLLNNSPAEHPHPSGHDKAQKSPIQLRPYQKEQPQDCYSVHHQPQNGAPKSH